MEQTLGHRAHTRNIQEALAVEPRVRFVEVEYPEGSRAPIPWALRGSAQAMRRMRNESCDIAFYHTQTISLFAASALRGDSRFVVSVDATPLQLDTMGTYYAHARSARPVERAKGAWYRNVFRQAAGIVAWSGWAADSLVEDYGVAREQIEVVHPGASDGFFEIRREPRIAASRPRILFVGGDFARKGGQDLLAVYERLQHKADLTLVTDAPVAVPTGVEVLNGVRPGSAQLYDAFARADIFCLPTYGDCTPVVLAEAQAAGLPVITTHVGSNASTVLHGRTGFVLPPGDRSALEDSLSNLIACDSLRRELGCNAREHAHKSMDASANARRLLQFATRVAP